MGKYMIFADKSIILAYEEWFLITFHKQIITFMA